MDQSDIISENDCCGNGCANCVLNVGFRKSSNDILDGKFNVISDYQKFRLVSKCPHKSINRVKDNLDCTIAEVMELHFCLSQFPLSIENFALIIPPGYHVMMRQHLPTGPVCLRPYSPFWVDPLAMEFKILINLAPNGPMSHFIRGLQVGDCVEFRGPIGSYEYSISTKTERKVFVITQGVAIAATIRIVSDILNNEEDFSHVFQLACYKDLDHAYFRDMLRDFNKYWNYKSSMYLAHQRCSVGMCKTAKCTGECSWFLKKLCYKEDVHLCRLSESNLSDICKGCVDISTEYVFIIAGSNNFQEFVTKLIKKMTLESLKINIVLL